MINETVQRRIDEVPSGTQVLIHLNNEAGVEWFSVEPKNDTGNWINSFEFKSDALAFIEKYGYKYDPKSNTVFVSP